MIIFNSMYSNSCCHESGRASGTVGLDVLITLLSLGVKGWKELLEQRKAHFSTLRARLEEVAVKHGERVLHTPKNNISIGKDFGYILFL